MFFPNSVLISRTPGIATIWLMATLGAKQNSRKVSKQAVLQVDIPESCQAIQHPDVPMALRLQSNLLYGISRVYSQQCLFILNEAEIAQSALKNLFKHTRASGLDPHAGRIRPELLVVPDDPAFLSGFDFPIVDFDSSVTFDSSGVSFMIDSDASGLSILSSQSNKSLHEFIMPQLDISSSGSIFGEPSLPLGAGTSLPNYGMSAELAEPDFLYDADFEFDAAGNIVEHDVLGATSLTARQSENIESPARDTVMADTQAEHSMPGITTEQSVEAYPVDDAQFLPDDTVQEALIHSGTDLPHTSVEHAVPTEHVRSSEDPEYVEAPQTRRRRAQPQEIPRDTIIQVPNTECINWDQDYVENMEAVRRTKESRKYVRHAKANAVLVLCNINQSTTQHSNGRLTNPIHNIAINLVEQITGRIIDDVPVEKNNKRRFDSTDITSSDSETRKSRPRVHGPDEASHEAMINADGDVIGMLDDLEPSIELAREAMTMMEDQSTQLVLPWSGSRAGSVHSGRLSQRGSILSTRAAGNTSVGRAASLHSFDRRTSRLRSASPLFGQTSVQYTPVGLSSSFQLGSQNDDFLFDIGSGPATSPHRPMSSVHGATLLDTMAGSSMHSLSMTQESAEFLDWIQNALHAKTQQIEAETDAEADSGDRSSVKITFEELLPPNDYARAVAAQGFSHLLTLVTRGAIEVSQPMKDDEGNDLSWGPIYIGIAQAS